MPTTGARIRSPGPSAERKNSVAFISFLEELLVKCYPTGRIVLVMGNATYHKSTSVLVAPSLFEHRVVVIWLPPYSDLNRLNASGDI
jgi:transposase